MHLTMSANGLEPVAILWDIENCCVPQGVNAEDVAVHIRMALKLQLAVRGPVMVFSAYGDFSRLPLRTRQGCQKTGVDLINIPHGKKDAADKAILVDMFLFALDNPPPCTVVLISGDVDFAPALHKLGQRGYSVVLAIPCGRKVSPALLNACQHLWSWPDIARGKGTHPTHKALWWPTLHEGNRKETLPSTIITARKTPRTCVAILDDKHLETVLPSAETVGGKGLTTLKSALKDSKPSETIVPDAENFCIDQVEGNDHAKRQFVDGVGGIHPNFGKLEVGHQSAYEVSEKIPVELFEEHVKVPFSIVKESAEIPVVTGMDHNDMGATDIPLVMSHGMAGFAGESVKISVVTGMGSDGKGALDMNRSMLPPPSCSTACPMASIGMTGYENIPRVTSQGMDGCITRSNFIPLVGQHVNDQFAIPYPGGVTGAVEVGEEVFGHSWKGLTHQMEADYEHHFVGMHHKAGDAKVGPLFDMGYKLANTPDQYALLADGGWDNHYSFPSHLTHANAQVPVGRSQNIQQLFTNFKHTKAESKQAARVKGQGPSLQLKVKKKKMKKAKKKYIVESVPAATVKLTKKQRRAARFAAIQTQGTELNNTLAGDKIFTDSLGYEPHANYSWAARY